MFGKKVIVNPNLHTDAVDRNAEAIAEEILWPYVLYTGGPVMQALVPQLLVSLENVAKNLNNTLVRTALSKSNTSNTSKFTKNTLNLTNRICSKLAIHLPPNMATYSAIRSYQVDPSASHAILMNYFVYSLLQNLEYKIKLNSRLSAMEKRFLLQKGKSERLLTEADATFARNGYTIESAIQLLMRQAEKLRTYGIKPVSFRRGSPLGERTWISMDPRLSVNFLSQDVVVGYLLTGFPVDRFNIVGKYNQLHKALGAKFPPLFGAAEDFSFQNLQFLLTKKGELQVGICDGYGLPASQIFADRGLADVGKLLGLLAAASYYDLVVPDRVCKELDGTENRLLQMMRDGELTYAQALGELCLARIRYIEEMPDMSKELEGQVRQQEQETSQRINSDLRGKRAPHHVVGHTRALRKGHKASDDARARAKEAGITLGPNETWVQSHWTGQDSDAKRGPGSFRRARFRSTTEETFERAKRDGGVGGAHR